MPHYQQWVGPVWGTSALLWHGSPVVEILIALVIVFLILAYEGKHGHKGIPVTVVEDKRQENGDGQQ